MICNPRVRFGGFEADLATGELFHSGHRLSLQEKPFQILALLLQAPGQLITRREISSKVWPGVFVEKDLCLNTAIRRLRAVLESTDPDCNLIETVGRRGYRLRTKVELSPNGLHVLPSSDNGPRLAVLPFTSLDDEAQHYFVDGLSEQLIVQLGRVFKRVSIISPMSSLHFKGTAKSLSRIAKELKVDYVLSGCVWRIPPLLRVTVKLTRAADQCCLWSESYTPDNTEVFRLQDEITRAISRGLFQALPAPSPDHEYLATTPEIYEIYLKARFFSYKFVQGSFEKAIKLFEQVISDDPDFGPAYAALGHMLTAAVTYGGPPHRVFYDRIEALANKALAISEELAEAHCALAWSRAWQGDWVAAERGFLRAQEINPSFPYPYVGYAHLLSALGQHEQAIIAGKRACELDPLSPIMRTMLGMGFYMAGKMPEAIECQHVALEIDPGFCPAHGTLGFIYHALSDFDQSVSAMRAAVEHGADTPLMRCFLAWSLAAAGERAEASAMLANLLELRKTNCLPATSIGLIYAALGWPNDAWAWLKRAAEELDPWRLGLAADPRFKCFWNDARFPSLLRTIGLPSLSPNSGRIRRPPINQDDEFDCIAGIFSR